MSNIDSGQIQGLINQHFIETGKDFATLRQLLDNDTIANALGINSKVPQHVVLSLLTPHLGTIFRLYQIGSKTYLGRNQTDADLIMTAIRTQSTSKTFKQWMQLLPVSKEVLLETVNQLLDSGQLSVRFNSESVARLVLGPLATTIALANEIMPEEDAKVFQAAYEKVRNGRDTVRIHKMREYLNWPIALFDTTLAKLRADYAIDLHLGDPSRLSTDEVKSSYIDPHGMLYIGLSWRV